MYLFGNFKTHSEGFYWQNVLKNEDSAFCRKLTTTKTPFLLENILSSFILFMLIVFFVFLSFIHPSLPFNPFLLHFLRPQLEGSSGVFSSPYHGILPFQSHSSLSSSSTSSSSRLCATETTSRSIAAAAETAWETSTAAIHIQWSEFLRYSPIGRRPRWKCHW